MRGSNGKEGQLFDEEGKMEDERFVLIMRRNYVFPRTMLGKKTPMKAGEN